MQFQQPTPQYPPHFQQQQPQNSYSGYGANLALQNVKPPQVDMNGFTGNLAVAPTAGPSTFPSVTTGTAIPTAIEFGKQKSTVAIRKTFCVVCASNNVG